MRKMVTAVVLCAAMAFTIAGCGSKSEGSDVGTSDTTAVEGTQAEGDHSAADASLEDIKNNGKFVIGLDASFPPMGFRDEKNAIVGYDIDVAAEVCKRLGVELITTPINWDAKEQELNTKNIDCIWNGFTLNEEREKSLQCSKSYMKNTQVAVVLATSKFKSLDDLKGKNVVVQKGSTASDAMDNNPDFSSTVKLTKIADNIKALMDLGIGSDAVVMDEVVARYYTEKEPGKYTILDSTLATEEYVIGFRKGDVALCSEVEKIMQEMVKDGTMSTIDKKWFGKDSSTIAE